VFSEPAAYQPVQILRQPLVWPMLESIKDGCA
jgi:hypothetical protein